MTIPDPYKVLQVDPEAEAEVIEAAYRRLARKYHPDVSPDPESQERMVRINQAWELLRDPQRRAAVDRARVRASSSARSVAASGAPARDTTGGGHRSHVGHAGSGDVAGGRQRDAHPSAGPDDGPRGRADAEPQSPPPDMVSRDWTSGRSASGGGYANDMATPQGEGAAGPPPGNPWGSVMTFGRYSGWSLGEIARADLEYLEWLDRAPIGRGYQQEIDDLLRSAGRRASATPDNTERRGLFRRR